MKKKAFWIIGASLFLGVLDAIFKVYAIKRLPEEGARFDFPIGFALHKNPGIAFDIPVPFPITFVLTILIVGYLVHLARKHWKRDQLYSAFCVIVITGALGNLFDRIINNFTTDYIILFNRSAINISDILIVVGTVLLLGYSETKESR